MDIFQRRIHNLYRGWIRIQIKTTRFKVVSKLKSELDLLTLIVLGGGQFTPRDAKFRKKCPCLHNNNTALIKQISLYFTPILLGLTSKPSKNDPIGLFLFLLSDINSLKVKIKKKHYGPVFIDPWYCHIDDIWNRSLLFLPVFIEQEYF